MFETDGPIIKRSVNYSEFDKTVELFIIILFLCKFFHSLDGTRW